MLNFKFAIFICVIFYISLSECTDDDIKGNYKLSKSDNNFSDYLKDIGVGGILRLLTVGASPSTEIEKNAEGEWNVKTITTFKTTELKFKPDVPFVEITGDGRRCESVVSFENGNKFIHKQNKCRRRGGSAETRELINTREFKDGKMILTLSTPTVTSVREYLKA